MAENNRLIADVKALEAAADLPIPGAGDAGKVVTVNPGHTGYQLDANGTSGALTLRDLYYAEVEIASGGNHTLTWTEADGAHHDHLLDLTAPTLPTVAEDGIYAVTLTALCSSGALDKRAQLSLEMNSAGGADDAYTSNSFSMDQSGAGAGSLSATFFIPADGSLKASIYHDKGTSETFFFYASVVRLA